MTIKELLKNNREEILRIAARYNVINIRVFGSAARGDADSNSDIDFVVELEQGWGLIEHLAFKQELEALLGRKVDVVVEQGLRDIVRDRVLSEATPL